MTTPTKRRQHGRLGGLATAARHDVAEYTAPGLARANSMDKWIEQTDPTLPEEERLRRAQALRKEHYARLSLLGQAARQKKARARRGARHGSNS